MYVCASFITHFHFCTRLLEEKKLLKKQLAYVEYTIYDHKNELFITKIRDIKDIIFSVKPFKPRRNFLTSFVRIFIFNIDQADSLNTSRTFFSIECSSSLTVRSTYHFLPNSIRSILV